MTNKNKTISFRISEQKFDKLRSIADGRDLSLSEMFREYVDTINSHGGQIEVIAEPSIRDEANTKSGEFPPTIEVSTEFVREHERLELECEHLRKQLDEYKQHASKLEAQLERSEKNSEEMVRLEELDFEAGTSILVE